MNFHLLILLIWLKVKASKRHGNALSENTVHMLV